MYNLEQNCAYGEDGHVHNPEVSANSRPDEVPCTLWIDPREALLDLRSWYDASMLDQQWSLVSALPYYVRHTSSTLY